VEVTTFKNKPLIKTGHGEHPNWPSDQEKEKLDPPRFQMLTADDQGKSSKDSLMRLFDKSPTMAATTAAALPTTAETTTSPAAASLFKKLSQKQVQHFITGQMKTGNGVRI
jgi:hypothetical protein